MNETACNLYPYSLWEQPYVQPICASAVSSLRIQTTRSFSGYPASEPVRYHSQNSIFPLRSSDKVYMTLRLPRPMCGEATTYPGKRGRTGLAPGGSVDIATPLYRIVSDLRPIDSGPKKEYSSPHFGHTNDTLSSPSPLAAVCLLSNSFEPRFKSSGGSHYQGRCGWLAIVADSGRRSHSLGLGVYTPRIQAAGLEQSLIRAWPT